MNAKIILLLILCMVFSFATHAQIPNCDPTVPVFYIDFTGASSDSTWTSPSTLRSGNCCSSAPPEICVLFIITTGVNTAAIVFSFSNCPPPNGSILYQVDCGAYTNWTDTTIITTPGVHYLTYCKPGNVSCTYSITSLISIPTGLIDHGIVNPILLQDFSGNYFLNLNSDSPLSFTLNIFSVDGKNIAERKYSLDTGKQRVPILTQNFTEGVYFCRITGQNINRTLKFIK